MNCPCKGCGDRWVTDHSRCDATCTRYAEWKERMNKLNNHSTAARVHENRVGNVLFGRKPKI